MIRIRQYHILSSGMAIKLRYPIKSSPDRNSMSFQQLGTVSNSYINKLSDLFQSLLRFCVVKNVIIALMRLCAQPVYGSVSKQESLA